MTGKKLVQLPPNLAEETKFKNKSFYVSDYCSKRRRLPARRRMRTNETQLYSTDIQNPATMFLHDHYQTSSHRELKRHCEKILSSIERSSSRNDFDFNNGRDRRTPIHNGLPATPPGEGSVQSLADVLPFSLRRIEAAWQDEKNASKRDRGDIYGKGGAKKWYHQREKEEAAAKATNHRVIPGLSKWLSEANEYEKVVIHDFMKNVSDTIDEERNGQRGKEHCNMYGVQHHSDNPNIEDYLDYIPDQNEEPEFHVPISPPPLDDDPDVVDAQQFLEAYEADLSQENLVDEIEAQKISTFNNSNQGTMAVTREGALTDSRCTSRAFYKSVHKEMPTSVYQGDTQLSEMKRSKKHLGSNHKIHAQKPRPSSPEPAGSHSSFTRLINRAQSAQVPPRTNTQKRDRRVHSARPDDNYRPQSSHFHRNFESNCKACQDQEIRKIAGKLAEMEPRTYRMLREEMGKRPKMAISKTLRSTVDGCVTMPEDLVYASSVFGKSTSKGKGHFTIHPEWSSERIKPKKSYR